MKNTPRLFVYITIFYFLIGFSTQFLIGKEYQQSRKPVEKIPLTEVIKGAQGNWAGRGVSEEVRYRHPEGLLTLIVKHTTEFIFHVDEEGKIEGEGTIIYNLEQNTTGLDDLVAQVRNLMALLPSALPSKGAVSGIQDQATKDKLKGLTKIQYDAPHLKYGQELRHFKFKGRIAQGTASLKELSKDRQDWEWPDEKVQTKDKVIHLEEVINFTLPDGTPNSTLIAESEVNKVKEEKAFPCWSPFLKNPGTMRQGPGGIWIVEFMEKGEHRNNVNVWQEYSYVWMARQINKEK